MQEDTVGNGPFGYTASETCDEDARKESFRAFLLRIAAEDKGNSGFVADNQQFTQQQQKSNVSPD